MRDQAECGAHLRRAPHRQGVAREQQSCDLVATPRRSQDAQEVHRPMSVAILPVGSGANADQIAPYIQRSQTGQRLTHLLFVGEGGYYDGQLFSHRVTSLFPSR